MERWLDRLKNLPTNELPQLGSVSFGSPEYKANEKFIDQNCTKDNVIFDDDVEKLDAEHLARCKQTEVNYANIKITNVYNLPIWIEKKSLSNTQLEQLEFLLGYYPPIIEGCKLHDILMYADPEYDYLQLRDPEMLKVFTLSLKMDGTIVAVISD